MSMVMVSLLALGLLLLFASPWLARLIARGGDAGGLTRILQAVALIILVVALLTMPRSPESTAFPAPEQGPPGARP